MELGEERIEPEDSFSDITLVAPVSISSASGNQVFEERIVHVLKEIRKNIWGCDLIMCLFTAALHSYRSDKCLRPFPPMYIAHQEKDFASLRSACDNIPPLKSILMEPKKFSQEVYKLIIWLFLDKGYPILRRVPPDSVPFPGKFNNLSKPHFVFEVCYQEKAESAWQQRRDDKDIILAYHGSSIDNFYSILKAGLQQHFSLEKAVLFGNGIYLSDEISISAHYSPFGRTWKNSCLGNKHSVIAICEIINDVEKVKCKDSANKKRANNKDSLVGEIPEKYFVVTDSDMVRVKYLMVYREKNAFSVKSFIVKHLFLFLIVTYIILILFVAIYSNSSSLKSLKKLIQTFSK